MLALMAWLVAGPATVPTLDAPVTAVTVYSYRAQVTRTAALTLAGRTVVAFPLLPALASAASIRLEATGGEVESITIAPVTEDELPVDEARSLLDALDKLDRQIALGEAEHQTLVEIHDAADELVPVAPEVGAHAPAPRLDPSGWVGAMSFLAASTEALQRRLSATEARLKNLREQRQPLAEQAQALGAQHPLGGQRVTATVSGKGSARLLLSYEVSNARWYPSYDIQLTPARNEVSIAFAGLVGQETGEDWTESLLTLSTATPAESSELPKLTAWRIGTSERFVPTPVAEPIALPPPPPASPRPPPQPDEIVRLRQLLAAAAIRRPGDLAAGDEGTIGFGGEKTRGEKPTGRMKAISTTAALPSSPIRDAPAVGKLRKRVLADEADGIKELARKSDDDEESAPVRDWNDIVVVQQTSSASSYRPSTPRIAINIAGPPAYHSPRPDPTLPAALAAGRDMAFPSAARETVGSRKGTRRVALFSQTWPVSVERLVFPALAKEAFLVAEIKNPSKQPLPGGRAHLFVGNDPAGVADLKLVAPGETFTLPLGIDQAWKPIRNVTQSTVETGLISKDETTEYTTTIEFANPYPAPLPVRVRDQIPVTADKDHAQVKLVRSDPPAKLDAENGALEWRMTVPSGATVKLTFVYSIKRPKGARMVQQ
jgi:hypothetical protein